MNEEMMQLPLQNLQGQSGRRPCPSMVAQIPVFGLYQALLHSIELRHVLFITHLPFTNMIWLADLGQGPILHHAVDHGRDQVLQQKMTPAPGDPTQAKVMLFMPVIFTFMFLNFPSDWSYWLVNNVIPSPGGADAQQEVLTPSSASIPGREQMEAQPKEQL